LQGLNAAHILNNLTHKDFDDDDIGGDACDGDDDVVVDESVVDVVNTFCVECRVVTRSIGLDPSQT
jgi:hypothetical protein